MARDYESMIEQNDASNARQFSQWADNPIARYFNPSTSATYQVGGSGQMASAPYEMLALADQNMQWSPEDVYKNVYLSSPAATAGKSFQEFLSSGVSPWRLDSSGKVSFDPAKHTEWIAPQSEGALAGLKAFATMPVMPLLAAPFAMSGIQNLLSGAGAGAGAGAGTSAAGAGAAGAEAAGAGALDTFLNTTPMTFGQEAATAGLGGLTSTTPVSALSGLGGTLPAGGFEALMSGTGLSMANPVTGLPMTIDSAGNTLTQQVGGSGSNLSTMTPTSALPTAGGATQAAGTTTSGMTSTAASGLSQFLKDNLGIDVSPSTLSMLGTLGATGLGAYASNQNANALQDIANQQRAERLPALNAFNSALQSPDTWYNSAPAMGASNAVLRQLSMQGNPANNPTSMAKAAAYNLGGYNDYLKTTGSLGLSGSATTAGLQTQAANAGNNVYNALGSGLGSLTNNQPDYNGLLSQILMQNLSGTRPI